MADATKPEPGWYAALLSVNGKVMRVGPPLDDVMRDAAATREAMKFAEAYGWHPIETAAQDGKLHWVYTAAREGLPAFEGPCAWHPDAGWCTDELRPVTHWHPKTTQMLRDAEYYRWLRDHCGSIDDVGDPGLGTTGNAAIDFWVPVYRRGQTMDEIIDAEIAREKEIP